MIVAVIGLGYWGPNLVRNFLATQGVEKVLAFDTDPERCQANQTRFPNLEIAESIESACTLADAVILATPLSSHYALAKQALEANCHVMIEKPFTESSAQAAELISIAEERKLVLMVDHTFLYTGAVRKLKSLMDAGDLGQLLYFDSVRVNLGLFQHDTNVIWDLAPHDLSIIDHLVGSPPLAVQAVGAKHYYEQEDVAYLTVFYPDNLLAHFHVNWISPVKVRKTLIGGSKNMVVYDDMEPSEKIRVYDKGVELGDKEEIWKTLVSYRTGDMHAPIIENTEALLLLAQEFVQAITQKLTPLTDSSSALRVVQMLEAAQMSLDEGGRRVELRELS
jgi:predicted dehydrogenase